MAVARSEYASLGKTPVYQHNILILFVFFYGIGICPSVVAYHRGSAVLEQNTDHECEVRAFSCFSPLSRARHASFHLLKDDGGGLTVPTSDGFEIKESRHQLANAEGLALCF